MFDLQPKDLVAILTLALIALLKLNGLDGALDPAAALILGYYFVKRSEGRDNGV